MREDTVIQPRQPGTFSKDPLIEEAGRCRIVRYGYLPEREIQTGIGPVGASVTSRCSSDNGDHFCLNWSGKVDHRSRLDPCHFPVGITILKSDRPETRFNYPRGAIFVYHRSQFEDSFGECRLSAAGPMTEFETDRDRIKLTSPPGSIVTWTEMCAVRYGAMLGGPTRCLQAKAMCGLRWISVARSPMSCSRPVADCSPPRC